MPDREKVFDAIRNCITEPKCRDCPWDECEKFDCKKVSVPVSLMLDALKLLKWQEAEKEALASLASLADHRRERVGKVLYDLCELGYPHNFQHEAPWVVDYLYKLTAIIKRAYEVKNNDNT